MNKFPWFLLTLGLFLNSNHAGAISLPVSEDSATSKNKVVLADGRGGSLAVSNQSTALLRFDLPSGLAVNQVQSARLRLYIKDLNKTGDIRVLEVLSAWSEDTAGSGPGLSQDSVALPTSQSVTKGKRFVFFDVTTIVKSWLQSGTENHGLAVATVLGKLSLGAKENAAGGYPAELEIDINPALPLFVGGDPSTGLIDGVAVAPGSIATTQLADGSIVRAKLGVSAVGTEQIENGSITTEKIADASVGREKIAIGAVGSAEIADGSVGSSQIAPGSIGSSKLAPQSIGSVQLAAGAVGSVHIGSGSVGASQIASGSVRSDKLDLQYAMFWEEQPAGTAGGASASDAWQQRTLNRDDNHSNGAIARNGNRIILQPGVYLIKGSCPSGATGPHRSALVDVTGGGSEIAILGAQERTNGILPPNSNRSEFEGYLEVTDGAREFEIWHHTYVAQPTYGLGNSAYRLVSSDQVGTPTNDTEPSIFSTINILKIK